MPISVFFPTGTRVACKAPLWKGLCHGGFRKDPTCKGLLWGLQEASPYKGLCLTSRGFMKHLYRRGFAKPLGASCTLVHISVFFSTDMGVLHYGGFTKLLNIRVFAMRALQSLSIEGALLWALCKAPIERGFAMVLCKAPPCKGLYNGGFTQPLCMRSFAMEASKRWVLAG